MSESGSSTPGASGVSQEFLLKAPLPQFPGKQVTVFSGNFEPGSGTPMHRHAGTEVLYVLEGEGVMHVEGGESQELTAGSTVLVSPEPGTQSFAHRILNTDPSRPLTNLVIVIYDEGTPPFLPA